MHSVCFCRSWTRSLIKKFTSCLRRLRCRLILPVVQTTVNQVCIDFIRSEIANLLRFNISDGSLDLALTLNELSISAQNRQVLPKPMLTNMVQGSAAGAVSVMSGSESRDRTLNGMRMPPDSLILYQQDQAAAQATSGTATSTNVGDIQVSENSFYFQIAVDILV